MDEIPATEITRLVFYSVEWVISVIVWGATIDKLTNYGTEKVCYFGRGSNCGAMIFFSVAITMALSGLFLAHCLGKLPRKIEAISFFVFALIWALLAIISSASAPNSNKSSTGNAVAIFSWAGVATSLVSGGVAFYEHRQGEDELNHDLEK